MKVKVGPKISANVLTFFRDACCSFVITYYVSKVRTMSYHKSQLILRKRFLKMTFHMHCIIAKLCFSAFFEQNEFV